MSILGDVVLSFLLAIVLSVDTLDISAASNCQYYSVTDSTTQ